MALEGSAIAAAAVPDAATVSGQWVVFDSNTNCSGAAQLQQQQEQQCTQQQQCAAAVRVPPAAEHCGLSAWTAGHDAYTSKHRAKAVRHTHAMLK
jgi:hypothetical protein